MRQGLRSAAVALLAGAALIAPVSANAALGQLETHSIHTDPDAFKTYTPQTWNPHLAKLVTNGAWSYAVFTRYTDGFSTRVAGIYKRQAGSQTWQYAGRSFSYVHQHPGLALDREGRLHVVLDCWPNTTCSSNVGAGPTMRFFDLIFWAKDPDGSVHLGPPDQFWNYDEFTAQSDGYMGIATDPSAPSSPPGQSRTYVSVSNHQSQQLFFRAGVWSPPYSVVPHAYPPSDTLYPQIAISPSGQRYYAIGELQKPYVNSSFEYKGMVLYQIAGAGPYSMTPRVSESVPGADGVNSYVFPSDMSFGPGGELYFLYTKKPAVGGSCSYLLKETSPGSGAFQSPVPVGCRLPYAQLQVDSSGRIYIMDTSARNLVVSVSTDGGTSWTDQSFEVPISADGLPSGSQGIMHPTLVKPWTSPDGYASNALHGMVSNRSLPAPDGTSWSAIEFNIPISP